MKVTIVRSDNTVIVDGERHEVDCSKLPADVHAIQWDDVRGEIEYASRTCVACGQNHKPANAVITDMAPYSTLLDAWKVEAVKADETKAAANAPKS